MSLVDEDVLVLNKFFLATRVTTVRAAISTVYKGYGLIIDDEFRQYDFHQWMYRSREIDLLPEEKVKYLGTISSPRYTIYVPQVIYIPHFDKAISMLGPRYSRGNIYKRDKMTCQYCSTQLTKKNLTLDHIIPKSRGGENSFTNMVAACKECNAKKGGRTPEEAGMKLLKQPTAPRWRSYTGVPFDKVKKTYWDKFL